MKLIKPIQAHGETVTELNFREPNGDDITDAGFPFKTEINGSTRVVVMDAPAITRMIGRLTSMPPSSVKQMAVLDWSRALGEVMGFFSDTETQDSA